MMGNILSINQGIQLQNAGSPLSLSMTSIPLLISLWSPSPQSFVSQSVTNLSQINRLSFIQTILEAEIMVLPNLGGKMWTLKSLKRLLGNRFSYQGH
jgi:hypothetical protein